MTKKPQGHPVDLPSDTSMKIHLMARSADMPIDAFMSLMVERYWKRFEAELARIPDRQQAARRTIKA